MDRSTGCGLLGDGWFDFVHIIISTTLNLLTLFLSFLNVFFVRKKTSALKLCSLLCSTLPHLHFCSIRYDTPFTTS
ncbi:hypothetical protein L6452_38528 [Arctium lappa]|uniref:Uncharacterized protein n=1 Tax=Arctium lappa TaxID=4217 RepID=A0ACB8XQN4_ARCLA|nr:hypothetical protein L6452_38528 [Arctium lappa]